MDRKQLPAGGIDLQDVIRSLTHGLGGNRHWVHPPDAFARFDEFVECIEGRGRRYSGGTRSAAIEKACEWLAEMAESRANDWMDRGCRECGVAAVLDCLGECSAPLDVDLDDWTALQRKIWQAHIDEPCPD